jgi:hypothetical protein
MDCFDSVSRLKSVDLPTLGRPTIATNIQGRGSGEGGRVQRRSERIKESSILLSAVVSRRMSFSVEPGMYPSRSAIIS